MFWWRSGRPARLDGRDVLSATDSCSGPTRASAAGIHVALGFLRDPSCPLWLTLFFLTAKVTKADEGNHRSAPLRHSPPIEDPCAWAREAILRGGAEIQAGMAELADALVLGASAQKACRFKSCSRHHHCGIGADTSKANLSVILPSARQVPPSPSPSPSRDSAARACY